MDEERTPRMRRERVPAEHFTNSLSWRFEQLPSTVERALNEPRDETTGAHDRSGAFVGRAAILHADIASLMYERGEDVAEIAAWWDAHVASIIELYDYRATLKPSEFMALDWSVGSIFSAWCALSQVAWSVLLVGADDPRVRAQVAQVETGVNRVVDLVMALVVEGREVTDTVRHERPYAPLIAVIEAPAEKRAALMGKFVTTWYNQCRKMPWWGGHQGRRLASYVGYWCLEAAMVSVLLDIDDSSYRDNEFYPADLADHGRALRAAKEK